MTTTYTDSNGLVVDTSYTYSVVARNEATGTSDPSDEVALATGPPMPDSVSAVGQADCLTVDVTWSAPTGTSTNVVGYDIHRDGLQIATNVGTLSFSDTVEPRYTVTTATVNYRVIAVNSNGGRGAPIATMAAGGSM